MTVIQETILDEQGRLVLVVHIPKGEQRPYRTNRGVYFVCTTSGRQQASREELLRLFQATESLYYDETPIVRSSSIIDVELQAREDLLELARGRGVDVENIDPERLLHNWRLLREANGGSHLTLAGVLFLSMRNPIIYNMLLRIGLVTDAGSGIPRVIRLTRQAIGQEPAFRLEGNEFVVSLPRRSNGNGLQK